MASKSLTFDIFGRDKSASRTMNTIGANAAAAGKRVALAAAAIAAAIAVVVVRFGIDSVKAAAAAEAEQVKLTAAWEKFPKTADLAVEALQEYNSELAKKVRYDDDAIASGQSILAQFNLTGKQIQKLTPLLLDYAARTGKDLPTAARDLGKALLGQMRALKEVGVNLKDTGTLAGNFDQIMAGLASQVGGFAEAEGTTAAGKLEILKNRFGEVQEAIGFALMPTLSDLLDFTNETLLPGLEDFSAWFTETGLPAIKDFVSWTIQYRDILGPAAIAVGALTAAQWALNGAMLANPVGLVIVGVAALIALFASLWTNLGGMRTSLLGFWKPFVSGILDVAVAIAMGTQTVVNGVIRVINGLLGPINAIRAALGMSTLSIPQARFGNMIATGAALMRLNYQHTLNGTAPTATKAGSLGNRNLVMAEGGIVPARRGGWSATIGEAGQAEAVIPLNKLGGLGMGGTKVVIQMAPGTIISNQREAAKWMQRAFDVAVKQGAVPRSAFS